LDEKDPLYPKEKYPTCAKGKKTFLGHKQGASKGEVLNGEKIISTPPIKAAFYFVRKSFHNYLEEGRPK